MHPDWQTQIMRYCEAQSSPEPAWLTKLVRYTWLNTVNPRQLSGHLQGRLLSMLSFLQQPNCVLEIGTFTGYSALCLAEGLAPQGVLHTIEADMEIAHKAKEFIEATKFKKKIVVHHGNALKIIPSLDLQPNLVFVDAGKQDYKQYLEICLPLLKPNGLLIFDNTLWSQKVLNEEQRENDPDTAAMHEFNVFAASLVGVDTVVLPIRDGLTLIRKQ